MFLKGRATFSLSYFFALSGPVSVKPMFKEKMCEVLNDAQSSQKIASRQKNYVMYNVAFFSSFEVMHSPRNKISNPLIDAFALYLGSFTSVPSPANVNPSSNSLQFWYLAQGRMVFYFLALSNGRNPTYEQKKFDYNF